MLYLVIIGSSLTNPQPECAHSSCVLVCWRSKWLTSWRRDKAAIKNFNGQNPARLSAVLSSSCVYFLQKDHFQRTIVLVGQHARYSCWVINFISLAWYDNVIANCHQFSCGLSLSMRLGGLTCDSEVAGSIPGRSTSYGPITIAIRARFDYDSSTIQHPTRSYVLSSNNEHVSSFPLL